MRWINYCNNLLTDINLSARGEIVESIALKIVNFKELDKLEKEIEQLQDAHKKKLENS